MFAFKKANSIVGVATWILLFGAFVVPNTAAQKGISNVTRDEEAIKQVLAR